MRWLPNKNESTGPLRKYENSPESEVVINTQGATVRLTMLNDYPMGSVQEEYFNSIHLMPFDRDSRYTALDLSNYGSRPNSQISSSFQIFR